MCAPETWLGCGSAVRMRGIHENTSTKGMPMITIHQECVQISSRNSATEKPLKVIQLKRAAGEEKGSDNE